MANALPNLTKTQLAELSALLGEPPVLSSENAENYNLMWQKLIEFYMPADFDGARVGATDPEREPGKSSAFIVTRPSLWNGVFAASACFFETNGFSGVASWRTRSGQFRH